MKRGRDLLFVVAALLVVNLVAYRTLVKNQQSGVYPIDADSIGIPLFEGLITSALVLVLCVPALFLPKRHWVVVIFCIGSCGMAALLSLLEGLSWVDANHYPIAISYGLVVTACMVAMLGLVRQRASNKLLQATRAERAPDQ